MSHQSDLIATDITAYLAQHERKEMLRLLTCGSVDDGKSTLIGRLLHDSKMIYEDQLAAIQKDSMKVGTTGGKLDLALLVDGLQAEREQGITIDVAYRYFSTAKRKFIIADTPGHEQYTRNMATGASTCDLAIILIDARHGVQVQTRRHSFITSLLGIKHIVVAVNKMDLVDYRQDVFEQIKADYLAFSEKLKPAEFHFVPMSALDGDNVVNPSSNMPWYEGPVLMQLLENVQIAEDRNYDDFRFPVQYVNRPNLNFRGFCGTVSSGVVRKGDEITVLPSNKKSRIKSIVTFDEELELAYTDMAITITLEDEIDISRGDMIVHRGNLPVVAEEFEAALVWMTEDQLLPGKMYDFKLGTKTVSGRVNAIKHQIDVNTLQENPAPALELNEIALCEISVDEPVCIDSYDKNRSTGAFIVIDRLSNVTVGAGMITLDNAAARRRKRSSNTHVTREERAARYGQKPATVMFIGVSGAGKSTLAHGLERRLFDLGRVSTVLDGKAMRLGISKDLPHDAEGRAENLRRSAHIARFLNDSGLICCAAFVAPNPDSREHAMSVIGKDNCLIVYLNPPIDVCQQRDPSGIYAAAESTGSADIPGVSFPYSPPEKVDLELDTSSLSVDDCLDQVIAIMQERRILKGQ
ncbi:sulfate adenylyltransferase subunit CysN [Pseudohongiella spirulinae]|uniref:Sulfate adenylyltransferase subunit 1 n=1 Tax=Pseudohongiella spirulinae TaxID=1249552 RepID=A0A0S2KF71_9GAMM|nr:sulfate adenylyltransferase subunit CysN [Pseudohongiella spirulinae]ALO46957.1 adenylylsulfate kinase [Pseudohongiella spirulinae]